MENKGKIDSLNAIIEKRNTDVVIIDIKSGLSRKSLTSLKKLNILIVLIDDASERRLEADLAFYPPVMQVNKLNWEHFHGQKFVGPEYILLREEFKKKPSRSITIKKKDSIEKVLIAMGGSDTQNYTFSILKELDKLQHKFAVQILLGAGYKSNQQLIQWGENTEREFKIYRNVVSPKDVMQECDLGIVSFGVTAYEVIALGNPIICGCLTQDHEDSAKYLVKKGVAISAGIFNGSTAGTIAAELIKLLENRQSYVRMKDRASTLIDGNGAVRVATTIHHELGSLNK